MGIIPGSCWEADKWHLKVALELIEKLKQELKVERERYENIHDLIIEYEAVTGSLPGNNDYWWEKFSQALTQKEGDDGTN